MQQSAPATTLESPFGRFELARYPARRHELLRAWDAADEYLLNRLDEMRGDMARVLICNDAFGALSLALHAFRPTNWSDSWLAQEACRRNLQVNALAADAVEFCAGSADPAGRFDTVLIKAPKSLSLLDYQMAYLKRALGPSCRVWIAGMVKNMPASLWRRIETHFGCSETSRAVKKARVIEITLDPSLPDGPGASPSCWPMQWHDRRWDIVNHANVFAREGLDIGARLLIDNMPRSEGAMEIADLGCGNGVLGMVAAAMNSQARVHFIDESWLALESVRCNLKQLNLAADACHFHVTDGLGEFADKSLDRVLCNPPFHQQHAVGDAVAMSMFRQAARCLKPGGELWVVGNRHLAYHVKLRRWFASVQCTASNRKFVVLRALNILA